MVVPGAPNPVGDPSLYVNGGSTDDDDIPFTPPVPHGPSMPGAVEVLPGVFTYDTGCASIILLEIFAPDPVLVPTVDHDGIPCTRVDLPGSGHMVSGSTPAIPEMQITLESLGAYVSLKLLEADLRGVQVLPDMMFNAPATEQVVIGHIPPDDPKPGEQRGASWNDRRARFRWSRPVWTPITEERDIPFAYPAVYYPEHLVVADPVEFLGSIPKLTVRARPVQYRHATSSIRSFSRMLVQLTFSGTPVPDTQSTTVEDLLALGSGADGLKLFIREDGLYRVTYGDFLAAGLDLSFDPHNLKLFRQGVEVSVEVSGEADGSFDPGDYVTFFGKGYRDLYTQDEVYFLFADVTQGKRIVSAVAAPQSTPVPGDWTDATFRDKHYLFFNNARNGMSMEDRWMGLVIMPFGMGYDCDFDLPYVSNTSDNATLTIPLQPSMSDAGIDPDHHVRLHVNGTQVGEYFFDGRDYHVIEASFEASLLSSSSPNTISVECVWVPGTVFDLIYIVDMTLDYPRTWEADEDRLVATASVPGTHAATGFMLGIPLVYDVTDIDSPVRLLGVLENSGEFTFEADADHAYAFSTPAAIGPPSWVVNEPSSLRARENAYDYVIITHQNFRNASEVLAEHRRVFDGYTVLVVDIVNVYDEFGGGRKGPDAIRDFISYAQAGWDGPPEAVLLMGDASADTLGLAAGMERNFVPTYFFDTGIGYSMSDQLLAADETGLPAIALGRLPVQTAYEAERMVDKIMVYDLDIPSGVWTSRIILAADEADSGDFFSDYHAASDTFASYIPLTHTIEKAYFTGAVGSRTVVRDQIRSAFTDGALILNWTGHGGYDVWAQPHAMLDTDTVESLPEQPGQPFVIVSNCLSGAVDFPTFRTLAETLLARERGGAIGVFASGGATGSSGQFFLNQAVYQVLFATGERRLGHITRGSIEYARSMFVPKESLISFNLFGDPMQKLKE